MNNLTLALAAVNTVNMQQDGFDLLLFPWENAQAVIDEVEAVLAEMDRKPNLGRELSWPWGDDSIVCETADEKHAREQAERQRKHDEANREQERRAREWLDKNAKPDNR